MFKQLRQAIDKYLRIKGLEMQKNTSMWDIPDNTKVWSVNELVRLINNGYKVNGDIGAILLGAILIQSEAENEIEKERLSYVFTDSKNTILWAGSMEGSTQGVVGYKT